MTDPSIYGPVYAGGGYPQSPTQPVDATNDQPVSDQQLEDTASDILDTGDRFLIADDYDSRSVHFA